MTDSPSDLVPCPPWRRLLALLYDLLAVLAIVLAVGLACQLATGGRLIGGDGHARIPWWYQPLQGLVVAAYFLVSWRRGGQTLGMRPWRIRLVTREGHQPGWPQAMLRLLASAPPLLALGLAPWLGVRGALWALLAGWALWLAPMLLDRRRRTLPDLAAGTLIRLETSRPLHPTP
ncbi:RDD family protein [Frateuria defendens]|uniref:RDD family protein n=1 Tax=Frateuria defendens TaxID=2219559 RepID=UPI00066FBE77|nr:RDD family protein [Frateuria defendens]